MTQIPNNKRITCLQLALLPLFLAAVFLFSERTYAQEKPQTKNNSPLLLPPKQGKRIALTPDGR